MFFVEGEIPYYQFDILRKFSNRIRHGISTRKGGVSKGHLDSLNLGMKIGDAEGNLHENHRRFAEVVGYDVKKLVIAYQEHSDKILRIDKMGNGIKEHFTGVDGFVTNVSEVPLMVRFADCQGALFLDPVVGAIGAVHSGWRGNVQDILGVAVEKMVSEYGSNPSDIVVGISASLGPCCAEFSDPMSELPEFMHKYISNEKCVDLWKCSFDQLVSAGVLPSNIEIAKRCTVCENDEFFSYRGGKKQTGHMAGVITLI